MFLYKRFKDDFDDFASNLDTTLEGNDWDPSNAETLLEQTWGSSQGVPVMARVLSTQLPTIWGRLTCFSSVIRCISMSRVDGC